MKTTTCVLFGGLAALAACEPARPVLPTVEPSSPVAPRNGSIVWLEVSPERPRQGDTVIVVLRAVSDDQLGPIGAYVAELRYDANRVSFAGSRNDVSGMTAHNARDVGLLRIAGAAATGFDHGALFVAQFVAMSPDGTGDLGLTVSQLFADSRKDLLPALRLGSGPLMRAAPGPLGVAPRF